MEQTNKPEHKQEAKEEVKLIRILSKDIPGDKKVLIGLTMIKGISWAFSNAICKKLKIKEEKRISELSEKEIETLSEFIKHPELPVFLLNRRRDLDSGDDLHFNGADLNLRKEFDIKRLKKIKSYKGVRHTAGLPVRGQRTRANFRKNRKKSGATGGSRKK